MSGELDDETVRQRLIDIFERETRLFERLAEVGRGFGQAVTAADKQQNAMAALEAVIEYLNARKAGLDCIKPLLALWGDIENLCDGNEVDFLKPQRGGVRKRPDKSIVLDTVFAAASALIDHLVDRHGWLDNEAVSRVAKEIKIRGLALSHAKSAKSAKSDSELVKQLSGYRIRLNNDLRPRNVKKLYEETLDIIAPMEPENAIPFLLDFVGSLGAKREKF
ncbi:hypothetical protein [Microvirga sp. VF16]|uniref:hypothetical protein n=1 Tax=Microvirga sp. VF16 TaxID=2807101 RepID=UPI00193DF0D2|nr:hypothetical protein [Microvirga sp. VF16]QRM27375.1 hypothetical protein JO965_13805 [Microvirga sp. VF16]